MNGKLVRSGVTLGLLGLCYALLAVSAVLGAVDVFLVALLVAVAYERSPLGRQPARVLNSWRLGIVPRTTARAVLLTTRATGLPGWVPTASLLGLLVLQVVRSALSAGRRELRARTVWPMAWRNLEVPGLALPPEGPTGRQLRTTGGRVVDGVDVLPAAGLVGVAHGAAPGWLLALTALAVGCGVVVVATVRRRIRRLPARDRDDVLAEVREALLAVGPRVVIYFGGPPSSTHALNVWVPVLEQLQDRGVPVLVMVRQRVHLRKLASERLPAVWLPRATDVESAVVPSIQLALYPTNIAQNNHLLRIPGITDVFIGHGDSDKGGSSTPLSRIFDQIWVAGPAGRERYRVVDVGVRDEQVREVGRPQLADIERQEPAPDRDGRPFTVLYAPTWEGFYASWSYSSLSTMGQRIVSGLLALDGVRVIVKPHPASGSVDRAYGRAARQVVEAVGAAGAPHGVVSGVTGLYQAFNEADLLVTDVSSVVTDFFWSGKPYVMTNPAGLAEADYRREFPSSAGAAIWGPDLADLAADVADARGPDVRRADRERVARHLLGNRTDDATAGFHAAVDDALAAEPAGRPALPAPGPVHAAPTPVTVQG